MIQHNFDPVYNEHSKILILGSFPSVKSREAAFFYGHPQNRFWPLLARLLKEEKPETIEEKKAMILKHGIALYDAAEACDITGSSDVSMKNITPSDLSPILETGDIMAIFCNGRKSYDIVTKKMKREAHLLPSTSPANASYSMERLEEQWKVILEYL